jgi:2-haloacid dehalogenase
VGLPPARILHVAQSLFHDHVPAKRLGLSTVWVDRRAGRAGAGATPPATASPDLTVPDMATLASLATRT